MAGDLRQYPPTARRLRKLHEAGLFPYSRVLTGAAVLLTAVIATALAGSVLFESMANVMRNALEQAHLNVTVQDMDHSRLLSLGLLIGGLLLAIWIVAVLTAALQRGFTGSSAGFRLLPWEKTPTLASRSLSRDLAWELIVSATILAGAALIILSNLSALATVPPAQPTGLIGWFREIVLSFGWRFVALLVGVGLCDYLYQRSVFAQSAAMTRQELEQEIRETEGPWLVRWWRRRRITRT